MGKHARGVSASDLPDEPRGLSPLHHAAINGQGACNRSLLIAKMQIISPL
jgi:ankyrin repeat protein